MPCVVLQVPFIRWSVISTNLILDVGVDYTKLREFVQQTADSKPVSSV